MNPEELACAAIRREPGVEFYAVIIKCMMYQWEKSKQLAALRRDFSRCDDFGIFHHLPT
jgi:hypothetical protein